MIKKLFLVEGNVNRVVYCTTGVDQTNFKDTQLAWAMDGAEAIKLFTDFWEAQVDDGTAKYTVTDGIAVAALGTYP